MPLNERDRIEILMMIGVGDRMRTQQEVCRLFHEMHPDREPVSQSTVSRIERKYRELGHVRDAPRQVIMNKYEDKRLSRKQLDEIIDKMTDYESGAETEQEEAEPDNASELSEHESMASEIDSSDFEFEEQDDDAITQNKQYIVKDETI
ncbi:hypothetical protein NQ318_014693 [Aromia moschata]|uniref:DUF4817 domain-containing protein n=1 Tax=Aromia moschata TaxID=1265417 RepID=A0AAV8ZAY9_9CUCU|nr:hypothetical protein NQ318_014693 [Aromia moschata]